MKKISGIAFILFMCVMCPFVAQANIFIDTVRSMAGNGTGFCWFCPIFGTLFDAMNTIATNISRDLSQTFLAIMGVALLFSIGFKTAKMLTSLQAVDLMQYLTDMFRHLGRAIIASAFLWASLSIFTYVISPFLTMSLSLSTTIIEAGDVRATITKATQEINSQGNANINTASICNAADDNALPLLQAEATALDNGTAPQQAFAPSVKAALICLMRTVSASLISGMVVGATIYYGGIAVLVDSIMQIGTAFKMIYIGAFIVLGHIFIFAAVPFKYIDSMVRMAFVCALMPLWIILWVFPATTGYTKKAWDMFLSTCAIFLCMSVILVLVVQLINAAFEPAVLADVVRYLVADQAKLAAEKFNVSLKNLLVTTIMCFTGYKMLGTATTLASSFIGSIPNLGVGDQMAQSTVKIAQNAKTGAIATGVAAKAGLNKVGAAFGKPDLGNKVAASAGRIAGHTAAAIATGGLSLPISAGMAVSDFLKGRKSAGGSPAPERPSFGKGGSNMGIQAHDMQLDKKASEAANKANHRPDEDIQVFKDAAGNTVTQTRDKNTGKLKNEKFEDAEGRQLVKRYDQDGKLKSEQTRYSERATQETKDADKKKGNHKIWTKMYETRTHGNVETQTVTTKDEGNNVIGKDETKTTKDKNGNIAIQEHAVTDKNGNTTLSETTKYQDNNKVYTERKEQVDDGKGGKKEKRTYTNYSYDGNKEYREHRDGETGIKHTETITKDEQGREKEVVVREGDKNQSVNGAGKVIRETVKEYYKDEPDRLKKETTEDKNKGTKEEVFYERNSKKLKKTKYPDGRIATIILQNDIEIHRSFS